MTTRRLGIFAMLLMCIGLTTGCSSAYPEGKSLQNSGYSSLEDCSSLPSIPANSTLRARSDCEEWNAKKVAKWDEELIFKKWYINGNDFTKVAMGFGGAFAMIYVIAQLFYRGKKPGPPPPPAVPLDPITPPKAATASGVVDLADPARLNRVLAELDDSPGLESVSNQVRAMANRAMLDTQRRAAGLPVAEAGYHATFIGPAGTGKTTVARVWGKALAAMGVLPSGHTVEVDRAKLVGTYIGETAPKTLERIDEAMGGVLFIDEAYTLAPPNPAGHLDYGLEAVATLLKAMEDRRGQFVVIAAGYDTEMAQFLNSNSGLQSRFTHHISFPGYDGPACVRIFDTMCTKAGYTLTTRAQAALQQNMHRLAATRPRGWANARSVRVLLDAAVSAQAGRLSGASAALDREALSLLTAEDITAAFAAKWPALT